MLTFKFRFLVQRLVCEKKQRTWFRGTYFEGTMVIWWKRTTYEKLIITSHVVQTKSNNKCLYICDLNCPMFKGFSLCSHVVAVAEANGDLLVLFLKCNKKGCKLNLSAIANQGLPCGSGRKGGVPKRKRSVLLQLNLTLFGSAFSHLQMMIFSPILLLVLRVIHPQLIPSLLFCLRLLMLCLWLLVLVVPLTHA